jgi:hypothetical protein
MKGPPVEELTRLDDAECAAAVAASGRSFRFSHRAGAGRAVETAYPGYTFEPYQVLYRDGFTILFPIVRVTRRLPVLTTALAMPLGLEATPLPVEGEVTRGHVHSVFRALEGIGALAVDGGAGGSPPALGSVTKATTHTLDLRSRFEALWSGAFSSKNRNSCRKADRAGVEVSAQVSAGALEDYLRLYAMAAKGWGYADPPYPPRLFGALLRSGAAELWLARLDGQAIAGALLLRGSHDVFYWTGAIDRQFQAFAPSNAVLRTAIKSACRRGDDYVDFGASGGLAGVPKFKLSFGAQPREFRSIELRTRANRALGKSRAKLAGRATA